MSGTGTLLSSVLSTRERFHSEAEFRVERRSEEGFALAGLDAFCHSHPGLAALTPGCHVCGFQPQAAGVSRLCGLATVQAGRFAFVWFIGSPLQPRPRSTSARVRVDHHSLPSLLVSDGKGTGAQHGGSSLSKTMVLGREQILLGAVQ